jgi:hypothetical protein
MKTILKAFLFFFSLSLVAAASYMLYTYTQNNGAPDNATQNNGAPDNGTQNSSVQLIKQMSQATCTPDKTFGLLDSNTMFVSDGCRGQFNVILPNSQKDITGESWNLQRKECNFS